MVSKGQLDLGEAYPEYLNPRRRSSPNAEKEEPYVTLPLPSSVSATASVEK